MDAPLRLLCELLLQTPHFLFELERLPVLLVELPLDVVQVCVRVTDVALDFDDSPSRNRVVRSDTVFSPRSAVESSIRKSYRRLWTIPCRLT